MAQVLIITKSTNYEQIGSQVEEKVSQGQIKSSVFKELETSHRQHYLAIEQIKSCLNKAGHEFVEHIRTSPLDLTNIKAVFSIGGDGTLLTACEKVDGKIPVIGIRSSDSSVGYLCAGGIDKIPKIVDAFTQNSLKYTKRTRLVARIYQESLEQAPKITKPVLNDFLFANSHPAGTSRYLIQFRDQMEEHKSSGVWIATPSGSTAAILASGGICQDPEKGGCQFRVRELYAGEANQKKVTGSLFDPNKDVLRITNFNTEAILSPDGSRSTYSLSMGAVVEFDRTNDGIIGLL